MRYIDPSGHCFTEWLGSKQCKAAWEKTKQAATDAVINATVGTIKTGEVVANTWKEFDSFLYRTYGPESDSYKFIHSMTDKEQAEYFSNFMALGGTVNAEKKLIGMVAGAKVASSLTLRLNLIKAGASVPSYANAAHHIVAGSAKKAAQARAILEKFKININSAENGVFLPTTKGVSNADYHPSLHTNSYYERVNNLLAQADSREEAIEILNDIATQLSNGTFMK